jgi:hypothetical protein
MKNLLLLLLVSLYGTSINAQRFSVRRWDRLRFEIPVTNMIAPGYQRFGARAIYSTHPTIEFSAGGSYGLGISSLLSFSSRKIDQKFYEVGLGGRYFFNERRKKTAFAELLFHYRSEQFYRKDDWYHQRGSYLQYSGAAIQKKSICVDLLLGRRRQIVNRAFMNVFVGFGLRFNQLQHIALQTEIIDKPIFGELMQKFDRQDGFSVGVTPKVGVSVSFQPFIQSIVAKRR